MNEVLGILGVAGLFMLRVGLPVMLLVGLGILIDRWQTQREVDILKKYKDEAEPTKLEQEQDKDRQDRKAA